MTTDHIGPTGDRRDYFYFPGDGLVPVTALRCALTRATPTADAGSIGETKMGQRAGPTSASIRKLEWLILRSRPRMNGRITAFKKLV